MFLKEDYLTMTDWDKVDPVLLKNFIRDHAFQVILNANDTFGWACADAQEVDDTDLWKALEMYQKYGHDGVVALMAHLRDCDPIHPWITKEYLAARKELAEFVPFEKQRPSETKETT